MAFWRKRVKEEQAEVRTTSDGTPQLSAESLPDTPTVLQAVTPSRLRAKDIGRSGTVTLLATGIVNPFGPTLNVLAVDGEPTLGAQLPVLRLLLNPFTQEAEQVGLAKIGRTWNLATDLPPFYSCIAGSCPTVLLVSAMLDDEEAVALCSGFLQIFRDGPEVLEKIRRFPGDPWNRIQGDVDGLGDVLGEAELGEESAVVARTLTPEESIELAMKSSR